MAFFRKKQEQPEEQVRISPEYMQFLIAEKRSKEPRTGYEKFCRFFGKFGIKSPKSLRPKLEQDLVFSTINLTPDDVFSATILTFLTNFLL